MEGIGMMLGHVQYAAAVPGRPKRPHRAWTLTRNRYLTPQQVAEKLLPAAKRLPDPRVWFLLFLACNTGARVSEVLSIRGADVYPTEPVLRVMTLKRKHPMTRELRVPDAVMGVVREWMTAHNTQATDFLFQSPYGHGRHMSRQWAAQRFTLAAVSCGLKIWGAGQTRGNGIHSLRHANAIAWMERLGKVPGQSPLSMLLKIGERLGHADIKSTLTYLHPSQDREAVSAVGVIGKS